ncbi:unnamed protein product [Heligmosomoides polygyrus]|uniref:NUP160 middle TPR domain-containing protein n=1 Tax=Heligmosomoides polygyrus TaxID=6339 RepID=A0A3P7Z332_HELPZ|nr:unnamed protein product [Heligmosomoides polygyrus]
MPLSLFINLCSTYADMPATLRPVVTFYEAIAFSGVGKPLKAMTAFNSAAHAVTEGNNALLRAMSPIGQKPEQISALLCLQKHRHSEEVIEMARSAIASLPPGHECTVLFQSRIYTILFNHLVNQGNWTDALNSIIQNTDQELKRTTLRELISRMLHCHDWQSILQLKIGDIPERGGFQVENVLLAAARAQKATASPHLFKLVYSFYIKRNDFENAARAQYEYAFVLRTQAEQTPELLRRRRDALAVASTLLDLLPQEDRYLSFPDEEWVVANARVALLVTGEVPPCEPSEIVNSLISIKNYDMAFDPYLVHQFLHCVFFVAPMRSANVPIVSTSFRLETSASMFAFVISCAPTKRTFYVLHRFDCRRKSSIESASVFCSSRWAVVRGLLAAARRLWPDDSRPLRAVTRTFLAHGIPIPCWLDERDVGGYLRCLIEYGAVSDGLKVAASCVDEETKKVRYYSNKSLLKYVRPKVCTNFL